MAYQTVILKQLNEGCAAVRKAVFMEEQGFQQEFDDVDDRAYHVLIQDGERPLPPDDCSRRTAKHISSAELPCCLPIGGSIWENTLSLHWNSRRRHAVPSALPFRHNAVRQAFMKSWAIPKQKSITWTSFVPM